jgi:GDP-L-fucose synthase
MKHYDENEMINIGVGKDITISELSELIKQIVEFNGEIRYDNSKPDGTPRKLLDVSRLDSLGWRSRISLREGIEKTYKWYVEAEARVPKMPKVSKVPKVGKSKTKKLRSFK